MLLELLLEDLDSESQGVLLDFVLLVDFLLHLELIGQQRLRFLEELGEVPLFPDQVLVLPLQLVHVVELRVQLLNLGQVLPLLVVGLLLRNADGLEVQLRVELLELLEGTHLLGVVLDLNAEGDVLLAELVPLLGHFLQVARQQVLLFLELVELLCQVIGLLLVAGQLKGRVLQLRFVQHLVLVVFEEGALRQLLQLRLKLLVLVSQLNDLAFQVLRVVQRQLLRSVLGVQSFHLVQQIVPLLVQFDYLHLGLV